MRRTRATAGARQPAVLARRRERRVNKSWCACRGGSARWRRPPMGCLGFGSGRAGSPSKRRSAPSSTLTARTPPTPSRRSSAACSGRCTARPQGRDRREPARCTQAARRHRFSVHARDARACVAHAARRSLSGQRLRCDHRRARRADRPHAGKRWAARRLGASSERRTGAGMFNNRSPLLNMPSTPAGLGLPGRKASRLSRRPSISAASSAVVVPGSLAAAGVSTRRRPARAGSRTPRRPRCTSPPPPLPGPSVPL